ncbi:DUF4194 domain-containing protein [Skermania piniformis]|uniref:DUF4194 domain-containing protein n=1 Tax=Skermania pinensis TaxID=39122 RepID=A0ABX8SBA7_9ACTN|nr:DUF4194 domain-containing protein [Skermania piniformis]QXQ15082.1 DUF4194 domain-containing protein [Skermania piniformis]
MSRPDAGGTGVDFEALPVVGGAGGPELGRQSGPRFDGDVSELPDRACWALQNLLTNRYLTKTDQPQLWSWVQDHRTQLAVRLSELDLRLRIVDELDVVFVEQADYDSPWGRKLLRREPLNTYDSILALHLAKLMRAARDEHVVISREDIHELFAGVHNDTDRDRSAFDRRIDEAIEKLERIKLLGRSGDDETSYIISPVITAVMTASIVTDLQHQFERLQRAAGTRNDSGDRTEGNASAEGEHDIDAE